ncbi:unnamed protein product [Phytophthora lilii]|uniref:Unnamed protein product n=1 Tax=Phytophthora lilii TaxID=2077276 RepID=A0A9W6U9H7_9STRA|nr:unnamed protein product [Phytophthora lilii]
MQFSLNQLRLRVQPTLPSFDSMFPVAQFTSESPPIDASMTLGGLPPLQVKTEIKTKDDAKVVDTAAIADSNEIVTAFASMDSEAEGVAKGDGSLPLEFQCRYRRGKCSQPRTLKKNGSMHSYCEHHRLLSIRNQRVFDQKRRRQRQLELDGKHEEKQPCTRQQNVNSCSSVDDTKTKSVKAKKRPARRRRRTV